MNCKHRKCISEQRAERQTILLDMTFVGVGSNISFQMATFECVICLVYSQMQEKIEMDSTVETAFHSAARKNCRASQGVVHRLRPGAVIGFVSWVPGSLSECDKGGKGNETC
jgi:hypothetical protein